MPGILLATWLLAAEAIPVADGTGIPYLQYGIAGAIILVVSIFLKFMRDDRTQLVTLMTNHLAHDQEAREREIEAMTKIAAAMTEMAQGLHQLRINCEEHNRRQQ